MLLTRDHPRSRGENRGCADPKFGDLGSSPLTRGKLHAGHRGAPRPGIIPAHAGKTGEKWDTATPTGDHPRSRGENVGERRPAGGGGGSSPLTRGKRLSGKHRQPSTGIIPAHAGKTTRTPLSPLAWWDHPRSRGENRATRVKKELTVGSSPLTRGKPVGAAFAGSARGIIPAHAGKTGG